MKDWKKLWAELNERQQAYLRAVFDLDQENERYYKHAWHVSRDGYPPPASEWRWIPYDTPIGVMHGETGLKQRLRTAGLVDPGTGSTFEALESRGYIKRKWEHPALDYTVLYVKLTPTGRRLIGETQDVILYRQIKKRIKQLKGEG